MNSLLKNNWVRIVAVIAILVIAYWQQTPHVPTSNADSPYYHALINAIEHQNSDVQVAGTGQVYAILPDDNVGSRHQKFLIDVNGNSLLISHNIDLAPRIDNLQEGDIVEFFGEYEWTKKGGVVHWTHHDPRNRHPHGFLKHEGETYQ